MSGNPLSRTAVGEDRKDNWRTPLDWFDKGTAMNASLTMAVFFQRPDSHDHGDPDSHTDSD